MRGSGLELPDEVRRDCNRYIAGKWLFDFLHAGGEKLAPEVAGTCKNASLASATIVRIPEPRFPRLDADASPYLVRADGTYQRVRGGDFDVALPAIKAENIVSRIPNYNARKVKVQLSHWSQLLALPLTMQVALASADSTHKAR